MKIPTQILERLDPRVREAIIGDSLSKRGSSNYMHALEISDKNIKERTRQVLWHIYNNEGYRKFMDTVGQMKSIKDQAFNDMIQAKGEIAEVVLEVLIHQFMKERDITDWKIMKGLILSDPNRKEFSTELDIILVMPVVVSVIEIKSLNGEKTLTGDCFLTANSGGHTNTKDIFNQNVLHIDAFWKNFQKYSKTSTGVVKSVFFSFSHGNLRDERTIDKKAIMPAFDECTMPSYLDALFKLKGDPRWEVNSLIAALEKADANSISIDEHIAYVNSLHSKHK